LLPLIAHSALMRDADAALAIASATWRHSS
jgi:hypothetical protein